jgi:outer membrane protein OmpA-like peptidoglycan-associated protein
VRGAGLVLLLAAAPAAAAPAAEVRFIACPIYRDTDAGRKSGCWLVDNREDGRRYDVSPSPTKPDWNYAVLVEGRAAADQADVCGGAVLDPVRVSILPEPCVRTMLPAEGYPGRRFVLPERNVRPLYEPRPAQARPYTERTFHIPFEFGRSFVVYQLSDYLMDQAVAYALATGAREVEITGWAATDPAEVSGQAIAEPSALAKARADVAAQWMRSLGVPADRVKVQWRAQAQPIDMPGADGLTEPSRRRVDIRIVPGP